MAYVPYAVRNTIDLIDSMENPSKNVAPHVSYAHTQCSDPIRRMERTQYLII